MFLLDNFDHYYVKPEIVYLNSENHVGDKEDESKNFTNLNPLVVYTYHNDESDHEDCPEYITEHVETEIIEQEDEDQKFCLYNNGTSESLNGGTSENEGLVEPMMPFFLSDPSVFTILNEQNEVGVSL